MKKIEKMRFQVAALCLSGMCANFHNGLYPEIDARVKTAILMADCLIQKLKDPKCSKQYQREDV